MAIKTGTPEILSHEHVLILTAILGLDGKYDTMEAVAVHVFGSARTPWQKKVRACLDETFIVLLLQMYDGLLDMSGCSPAAQEFISNLQANPEISAATIGSKIRTFAVSSEVATQSASIPPESNPTRQIGAKQKQTSTRTKTKPVKPVEPGPASPFVQKLLDRLLEKPGILIVPGAGRNCLDHNKDADWDWIPSPNGSHALGICKRGCTSLAERF